MRLIAKEATLTPTDIWADHIRYLNETKPWEKHGVRAEDEWSALVFIRVHEHVLDEKDADEPLSFKHVGYLCVIDPKFADARWKMAGGRKQSGENPVATAIREMFEEAGVEVTATGAIRYVDSAPRTRPGSSWYDVLFVVDVTLEDVQWARDDRRGNEGEKHKLFSPEEFRDMVNKGGYFAKHLNWLESVNLIIRSATVG